MTSEETELLGVINTKLKLVEHGRVAPTRPTETPGFVYMHTYARAAFNGGLKSSLHVLHVEEYFTETLAEMNEYVDALITKKLNDDTI